MIEMKKGIAIFISIIILGGCSSGEMNNGDSATPDNELSRDAISNDVPQQLKEIDNGKMDNAILYWSKSYLDLLDSSFFENRSRESFYLKSHRVYRPGEQIEIDADSLPRDGRYEVNLFKFNSTDKLFETIIEETVNRNDPDFSVKIPEGENVTYYLEQIALNTKNKVLKQEFQRLFVPYNEVNAKIDIDKTLYSSGDTMKVTLTNLGTVELGTGYGTHFEKWDGERWNPYDFEQIVYLIAFRLRTGKSFSQDVVLKGFETGTYRVIEKIPGDHKISVAFKVE